MAFETPSIATQELRLATTMTGGVSLAVWMAGVAREMNLLTQASQWRKSGKDEIRPDNPLSKQAEESLRLYAGLINLLDIVVDVDILSGTSAGGINAALLASSRVRGTDLGRLRDLWLDLGALTDLLRDPTDKNTPSLLYGDERMFAVLAEELPKLEEGPFPPDGDPPTTLYVTTTLLTGETSQFTDSFGTLVQDVDRRGVFTFTEADLKNKDDTTVGALALAARSSASFPLAFEPSFVPFGKPTLAKGDVPARPDMSKYANITRSHWVADGGLLDNQPIDVLLKRVFDTPADGPVRRVLLFVVPSSGPAPEIAEAVPADDVDRPLGLVDGLLKDLAAVTTQSIAADLRTIRAHQDRMEARTNTRLRLAELARSLERRRLLTESLLTDYRTREATKQAHALTAALLRQLSTWPTVSGKSTEGIPEKWESELRIGGDAEKVCRVRIKQSLLGDWSKRPNPLPHTLEDLAQYGQPALDLAKGSALSIVQAAYQLAKPEKVATAPPAQTDMGALAELTKLIHKASEPPATSNGQPDEPPPPPDLGKLVRDVCKDTREGSLGDAADELAARYLAQSKVEPQAWNELGRVLVDKYELLARLASSISDAQKDKPREQDRLAARQLDTYLKYLGPVGSPPPPEANLAMARKLFDLAVTQRAMLPAEADIEQSLELVQVSADTRSLLAPKFQTAQRKLTGMQFHHFGAFYKRSWRANDWMWGRLDGAGWLVHVLLDPRRVRWIVDRAGTQRGDRARWFLGQLKDLVDIELPAPDYRWPPAADESSRPLIEGMRDELAFLDDEEKAIPPSIPLTSLWLAQAWQQLILDEELDELANAVIEPPNGKQQPDWSPPSSRSWAKDVLAASDNVKKVLAENSEDRSSTEVKCALSKKYALLETDPVARETLSSDRGSPLMAHTITKTAATASAAAGSVPQLPRVLKPPVITLQTLALGGYRAVSVTKGVAKWAIIGGAVLLVLGVAAAIQNATWFGLGGLFLTGLGGYLLVLGTWQSANRPGNLRPSSKPKFWQRWGYSGIRRRISRPLGALLSLTLVLAAFFLATPVVRHWLFGKDKGDSGQLETHAYWLGTQWWRPLAGIGVVIGAVVVPMAISATAAAKKGRRLRHALRSLAIVAGAVLLVFGVADAVQNARMFAVGALIAAWIGCYFIVIGTWWRLRAPLVALAWVTLVGAAVLLATRVVREWVFGTDRDHRGLVGANGYWLGSGWWHPLIVLAVVALVAIAIAAASPTEDDDADRSSTGTATGGSP
jgi:patatin-related protein